MPPTDPNRALPADHLASFEDDVDEDNVTNLIRRRARADIPGPAQEVPRTAAPAKPTTPIAEPETDEPPTGEPDRPKRSASRKKKGTPPEPKSSSAAAGQIRSTTIHVPYDIHRRFLQERERTGHSNGDLVKMALEATNDKLGETIGADVPKLGTLFTSAPAKAPRSVRVRTEPPVPVNARFYESDLGIIDELVATHGAYSRGHLISTALDLYLPPYEQSV